MQHDNPVALVTGSATGIGRATAVALAARGLDVVVNYSRSEKEAIETVAQVERAGRAALLCRANVGREDDVRRLFAECRKRFGRLDVLVNNAATTHFIDHKKLDLVTEEVWDEILDVNVKGLFWCCREAGRLFSQAGQGSIVNVASTAGVNGQGSSIPYAASKGAVITMTRSLAQSLAPGIRVNAVCPGPVETRWLAPYPEMVKRAVSVTPLQRASTPEDIASIIVFLALDAGMMTGQALLVDGGRTM